MSDKEKNNHVEELGYLIDIDGNKEQNKERSNKKLIRHKNIYWAPEIILQNTNC